MLINMHTAKTDIHTSEKCGQEVSNSKLVAE